MHSDHAERNRIEIEAHINARREWAKFRLTIQPLTSIAASIAFRAEEMVKGGNHDSPPLDKSMEFLKGTAYQIGTAARELSTLEYDTGDFSKEAREILMNLYRGFCGDEVADETAVELLKLLRETVKDYDAWSDEEAA